MDPVNDSHGFEGSEVAKAGIQDISGVGMIREQERVALGETRGMSRAPWEWEHPNPIPVWNSQDYPAAAPRVSQEGDTGTRAEFHVPIPQGSGCPSRDSSRKMPHPGVEPPQKGSGTTSKSRYYSKAGTGVN